MNEINDGGPAFPEVPGDRNGYEGKSGMPLRDYFAAKALQGLLADPSTNVAIKSTDRDFIEHEQQKFADMAARAAYRMADAMLRARGAA